mmetsp:Transcript_21680/g.60165  ORF Transcript_21680/g.60165 Transcript_21680/m.60165 type:complete len:222 (-) Transcript_21680:357-1022(-)
MLAFRQYLCGRLDAKGTNKRGECAGNREDGVPSAHVLKFPEDHQRLEVLQRRAERKACGHIDLRRHLARSPHIQVQVGQRQQPHGHEHRGPQWLVHCAPGQVVRWLDKAEHCVEDPPKGVGHPCGHWQGERAGLLRPGTPPAAPVFGAVQQHPHCQQPEARRDVHGHRLLVDGVQRPRPWAKAQAEGRPRQADGHAQHLALPNVLPQPNVRQGGDDHQLQA